MIPTAVGIIGLGLMGGSLARDLAERGIRVFGYDADPAVLDAAIAAGTVHDRFDMDGDRIPPVDLVVIATPVDAAIDLLPRLSQVLPQHVLVTDLGSTKADICRLAAALDLGDRFVGSHPLAGDHRSGWDAARTGLYQGASVFLCGVEGRWTEAGTSISDLWRGLGAIPIAIEPEEHDRKMAWVSHLPQVVASALAIALDETGQRPEDLGPGGRDMTRLAASSPEMWTAISRANAHNLEVTVAELQASLSRFSRALRDQDRDALLRFFRASKAWLS